MTPLRICSQAQALQGMAAAAQWGQPSTPFGMAGAGMWPAYPAMVAPSYGVGSNWAAAAQLNARCAMHMSQQDNSHLQSDATPWLLVFFKVDIPGCKGCGLPACDTTPPVHCRFGNNGFGGGGNGDLGGGAIRSPTVGPKDGAAGGELGGGSGMMAGGGWNSMMPTGGVTLQYACGCAAIHSCCCSQAVQQVNSAALNCSRCCHCSTGQ
jgi:hypothetical protein